MATIKKELTKELESAINGFIERLGKVENITPEFLESEGIYPDQVSLTFSGEGKVEKFDFYFEAKINIDAIGVPVISVWGNRAYTLVKPSGLSFQSTCVKLPSELHWKLFFELPQVLLRVERM